jgi:3-deoxy-7-phosphoheptulonate synthase
MKDQLLPSYAHVLKSLPLDYAQVQKIAFYRESISNILLHKTKKMLVIVGPCSIHDYEETLEYAERLKELSNKVDEDFYIVMRVFYEKSRTLDGWRGLLHDPHLDKSQDLTAGIFLTRKLLVEITKLCLPIATEILTPYLTPYFEDTLSFGCIGARTCLSQPHRLKASGLPFPIGFKNPPCGNMDSAAQGAYVASRPQTDIYLEEKGLKVHSTKGNTSTAVILRGALNHTNYSLEYIKEAADALEALQLPRSVIVDCAHGNAQKKASKQKEIFHTLLANQTSDLKGIMLESYLYEGNQNCYNHPLQSGVSVTDECLSFSATEELLLNQAACLSF